jgi:POT family proton-dependent oligopeptide transporter
VLIIVAVYAGFSIFQSETRKAKVISAAVVLGVIGILVYKYINVSGTVAVSAPIFQQFNPFYVVALTPVSMAIYSRNDITGMV